MMNLILTLFVLASSPAPIVKSEAPVVQEKSVDAVFRLMVIPAGERPAPDMEVKEVSQSADAVKIKTMAPAFAKHGWYCEVSPVRQFGDDEVSRSVMCVKVDGARKTLTSSSTNCPVKGKGRNYTTLNLGVGTTGGKLDAGVTLLLVCSTESTESTESASE